ncbi:winged helix-turn-helix domain-containing protein [Acidisphaera sp. S103]|uniref:ATP-binding protein n=1 Tax=Acidisphaera sp. S103 TaxID=1747223 RepID=UPI00131C4573|nr:winged helix-turn-helix domain-containing protein [Acidisphaera sp. S103]
MTEARDIVSFGPFTLVANERRLTRDGVVVPLGGRTLDMLIALVAHPGQSIDKRDLMAQVWPDVTVDEGSLRFHIARLRQALGDGRNGARYITTLAGRGYCFVAPVTRPGDHDDAPAPAAASFPTANVPGRLARMVGRTDGVLMLSSQLVAARFVTIVGAGGVGKTTVAVAVGHYLIKAFAGVVLFVDLGVLSDPRLAAASLASMLGLAVQSDDPTPTLIAYLRDKRILLILDNCEHLIEAAAALAAQIFIAASQVHILATSREALRVEGEHVHRLEPLAFPPDDPTLTAAVAVTYPAVQLFMERSAASGAHLNLTDADAAVVARICRRLDGVALAIELAAGRVEAYGLQQTAALLDERLSLLWQGQRTAPPRQQTLKATLDWSYELLTRTEQQMLRHLAVFVGDFTLCAALAVLTSPDVDQMLVFGAIESLVAKSMVATNRGDATMRYRLLDTTRDYVLASRIDEAERADLSRRHAIYYQRWSEETGAEWPTLSTAAERAPYLTELGNVRSALEWCFGIDGDAEIGVGLAATAAPVLLAMTLLPECQHWSETALLALDDATRGGTDEMHLQAALGISLMFMRGQNEAVLAALNKSLAIAEEHGDARTQLRLLNMLHTFHGRLGDRGAADHVAKRGSAVSKTIADPAASALGHRLLGMVLHHMGDHGGARVELEAALRHGADSRAASTAYFGFDGHILAGTGLARTLWLLGHPVQATERARQTVKEAADQDHPVALSMALVWAIFVFLQTGDLQSAEQHIDWFMTRAESQSLGPYLAVGRGFKGQLAIMRGDAKAGVESLRLALAELHASRYELLTTVLNISLAQGLAVTRQFAEGMALIDQTIRQVGENEDFVYTPELLRVKGGLLLSMPNAAAEDAETCFTRSLELSRRQGARAWELRTAIDLAAMMAMRGQAAGAHALLQPVFGQFVEGFDTADLKTAERLLASLRA